MLIDQLEELNTYALNDLLVVLNRNFPRTDTNLEMQLSLLDLNNRLPSEIGRHSDINISGRQIDIEPIRIGQNLELKVYTGEIAKKDFDVQRSEQYHSCIHSPTYSMRSVNRGIFFFVNMSKYNTAHKPRVGAQADKENLLTLFRQMGFRCFYYENLTKSVS